MFRWTAFAASVFISFSSFASAQGQLVEAKASFILNGERIKISRDTPQAASLAPGFAGPGGACGGLCVAPMQAAPGVETLGELEVLAFLSQQVAGNSGLMVDARRPEDRAKGFIPGSVSLPSGTVAPGNGFRDDILLALGARAFDGVYNFADARALLIYDGGPGADDAGLLVSNLLAAGYPPERLKYYRGGMQMWAVLGFSIERGVQ